MLVSEQSLALEKNQQVGYDKLNKIQSQLAAQRYKSSVMVDGKIWNGPQQLQKQLQEKEYSENQILDILNQIEFQTFATPLEKVTEILMSKNLNANAGNLSQVQVTINETEVVVSGTCQMKVNPFGETNTVGTVTLSHSTVNPLDKGSKPTGSYSASIAPIQERVLYV